MRRREPVETPEYAAMVGRMVRALGRGVAEGDPVDLVEFDRLQLLLDEARRVAVAGQRETGFSWGEIAAGLGISRQAVHQRFTETRGVVGVARRRAG